MTGLSKHDHLRRARVGSAHGGVTMPAPAAIVDGAVRELGPVPELGEHTDTVLKWLAAETPPSWFFC